MSLARIVDCHFTANNASGRGGAIYVSVKSELKVRNSQFTLNRAKEGGSFAVLGADSFIESSNLTSDTALLGGGCISLKAANMIVKHSHFSGCRRSIIITQSTLRLDTVTINDSYGTELGSALRVQANSDLFMKDSILTGCRFPGAKAITCSESSRMHLDSVLISNYSPGYFSGCVYSDGCNLTMDNITFAHWGYAMDARRSTIHIYNTVTLKDMKLFLDAESSHMTFWAFTTRDTYMFLKNSIAEFRHTLFIRQDKTCMIKDAWGDSTIKLKSVYVAGPTDRLVCGEDGGVVDNSTVVQGNVSGRTYFCFFTTIKK